MCEHEGVFNAPVPSGDESELAKRASMGNENGVKRLFGEEPLDIEGAQLTESTEEARQLGTQPVWAAGFTRPPQPCPQGEALGASEAVGFCNLTKASSAIPPQ